MWHALVEAVCDGRLAAPTVQALIAAMRRVPWPLNDWDRSPAGAGVHQPKQACQEQLRDAGASTPVSSSVLGTDDWCHLHHRWWRALAVTPQVITLCRGLVGAQPGRTVERALAYGYAEPSLCR